MSDLRSEGRPVRVGGSIELDMSKVAWAIADQVEAKVAAMMPHVVDGVIQALVPTVVQIHEAVQVSTGLTFPAGLMNQDDARATLCSMLPAGFLSGAATAEQVADFQLQRLTEAGYAVVPVAGAALEHAIKVAQHRQRLAEQGPAPDKSWHDIRTPEERRGAQGVDVDRYEATARADARLAQARHAGQDDSWHEPDQG
jgi:hypothetical protein